MVSMFSLGTLPPNVAIASWVLNQFMVRGGPYIEKFLMIHRVWSVGSGTFWCGKLTVEER
jgi:hypothetical protein